MSAPALKSPPIGELTTKLDIYTLLAEWVTQWFDGTWKAVGSSAVVEWPLILPAALRFDVSTDDQTQAVRIRCVLASKGSVDRDSGVQSKRFEESESVVAWYVTSAIPDGDAKWGNAAAATQKVAGMLTAIFRAPEALYQLRQKGIKIYYSGDPVAIPSSEGVQMQQVLCRLRAQWNISN